MKVLAEKPPALPDTYPFLRQWHENLLAAGTKPLKGVLGFAASWAAFFLVLLVMPAPPGMSVAAHATLAVVVWACITWITEAVPVGITGMQIPMLLVLSGAVRNFQAAASGYVSSATFICIAAFIMAAIIQAAALDRRIALAILHAARVKTVNGVIWSMFAVNFVLSLIVPGANPRGALLLPVVNGINRLLGDTPREIAAKKAIVIQCMVYGSMISGMCIMTAHLPNLVLVGLFQSQLKLQISYFQWFLLQWPYLGMFVLTQFWVQYYFKSRRLPLSGGGASVEAQYRELPKMSQVEWLILAAFACTAILWMTENLHGVGSEIVAVIGITLLYIPGLFGFRWAEIQSRTIWGTLLMLAGALSLSSAMGGSGLGKWLAETIHPLAADKPWWLVLLILMAGTHVIRIGMLSNVAAVSLFAPILIALAPKLGLHPVAFTMLVSDTDSFAYILPTQVTVAVIAYSSGTFSMADYAKVGIVSVLIAIAFGIAVMAPWYAVMGIPIWDPSAPWPF
jgi:solute carrier family 13 (sodium-dependent dicarboxylate transporter), member 2/3/5